VASAADARAAEHVKLRFADGSVAADVHERDT
jgi:hypothetical protein